MAKKIYDAEFKRNAVNLCDETSRSAPEVAKALGIKLSTLYKWRAEAKEHKQLA